MHGISAFIVIVLIYWGISAFKCQIERILNNLFRDEDSPELAEKISESNLKNYEYMFNAGAGETNIVFKWEDMTFLMSTNKVGFVFRIFWKEFDADWNYSAFKRTKKRFEKKS